MAVRRREPRVGTPADWLVLGLGNPGDDYADTRHNAGVWVVEELARRHGTRLRRARREHARTDEIRLDGRRVALAVPTTYMNESGRAAVALVRRFGIDDLSHLVVVHDELDLPVGRVKVKVGGGLAGHNGLRSIRAALRSDAFSRIRIGVGKPEHTPRGGDYVLKRPGRAERERLDAAVERAADAVEAIARDGLEAAMGRYNAAS
ncbi:MAG: aminoacyl-tRNA hydrolase [Actinomyces sp.]|nr:MAG: aminoacyl-tRNA hydrolase [Actinomyces sp.]